MKKIIVVLLFLLTSILHAESLYLNDGSVLQGTILNLGEKNIIIKTEYGTLAIERSKIKNIQFKKGALPKSIVSEKKADKEKKPLQPSSKVEERYKPKPAEKSVAAVPDSWYVAFTMGVSSNLNFSKDLSSFDDWDKKTATNMGISFYGTINKHLLLGGGIHVMVAKLSKEEYAYETSTYNSYERDLSVAMFMLESKLFLNKIGNGLFLEGGIGYGTIEINDDEWDLSANGKYTVESKRGLALKVGIGFALELEEYESALIFSVGGSYVQAKSNNEDSSTYSSYNNEYKISMVNFSIGILW